MAKRIVYQLATQFPRKVTVTLPLLDEAGEPVTREVCVPVTEEVTIPVLGPAGEPLLDAQGEPVTETVTQPVYDETGEPVMQVTWEPVLVTEVREEWETVVTDATVVCPTQTQLDANLPLVQQEAYGGAFTVEGEFDPEPETAEEILNAVLGVSA